MEPFLRTIRLNAGTLEWLIGPLRILIFQNCTIFSPAISAGVFGRLFVCGVFGCGMFESCLFYMYLYKYILFFIKKK